MAEAVFSTVIIGSGPCGLAVLSRNFEFSRKYFVLIDLFLQDCAKVLMIAIVD